MGGRGWAKGGRDAGRGSKQGRRGSAQHGRRGGDRAGGGVTWRGDRGLGGVCQDVPAGQDGGRRAGKGRRGVRAGGRRRAGERRRIYLASIACFFTRRRPPRPATWDKLVKSTKSANMEGTRAFPAPVDGRAAPQVLGGPELDGVQAPAVYTGRIAGMPRCLIFSSAQARRPAGHTARL